MVELTSFQRIGVPSKLILPAAVALPVPGAPMVMLLAAVIAPPPAKPPVSVTLPVVEAIFASVPEVTRAVALVMVMSPTALRSSPAPVVMKPLAA